MKRGFTLVELLVTIAIIATLSAILLPNFMGARQKAMDSKKIQDMNMIKTALRTYYNDNQTYPRVTNVTNIGATLASYMQPLDVGYTYFGTNSGDGFELCAWLDSGQGDDDLNSQIRCGIGTTRVCGVSSSTDKLYVVCAK